MNPDPVVYDIVALPDHPPTAKFTHPDEPLVKVPSNVPVALRMEAADDHGVEVATLHVRQGTEPPWSRRTSWSGSRRPASSAPPRRSTWRR